jgi:hypothetical protein
MRRRLDRAESIPVMPTPAQQLLRNVRREESKAAAAEREEFLLMGIEIVES